MSQSHLNFESFAQDAHTYVNELADDLGHPEEKSRVLKIWRAVMHTVRDRIHLGESFQIMDPLPMIFKGIYVENWKYREKPPLNYTTLEEMKTQVKDLQARYGEEDFPWSKSTEEIIAITLASLKRFLKGNQLEEVINQMPKEIKEFLPLKV
ncbi:DUF2267 domain-containing protein [Antarcticibacterium flavum]|uniref:DUF2267 domain-containing protein n=1 Tax=Antarcticibacterium flavum TaxID=2058175 RepID=A0A5B7X0T5_9FLAO|nr:MULTISPECIES: DUF2267 domain-containing protein [Antarcticibacterium]MCM4158950.1 DUF2267 domain-containing protein [Antarcticibacterium sp. W02-3]QCY68203.1 DUF2267 domain-containing protein [Antarcticibacterium flavum]